MSAVCQSSTVSAAALAVPMVAVPPVSRQPRQPLGFYVICLVVVCERWAAYTLASLAVLMLADRYGYSRVEALRLMSLANAASYLGTLPGAVCADRLLGHRRALQIGTGLLALGYGVLISSSALALIPSLLCLVLGSALFKPSTLAVLVRLYPSGDARLEVTQTRFYLAVNVGAASGALAAGLIVRRGGFSAAFALAAAAMLVACTLLSAGREAFRFPSTEPKALGNEAPADQSRHGLLTIAPLILAMLIYTVCAGQVEGSLLLWAQDRTNRVLLGFEVPAAWFAAVPALLIIALGPVQLAILPIISRLVDTRTLIALGLASVALAFVVLRLASGSETGQRISMAWLACAMVPLVIGELLVAPLGIAQLLRLTPSRHCGLAVGCWYLAGAMGHWLAGEVGALSSRGTGATGLFILVALPVAGAGVVGFSRLCENRQGHRLQAGAAGARAAPS